jgi:predicted transcriptional regulator
VRTVMSVSLPEKIAEELSEYARQTGRNKSDIVKESIRQFLWEARFSAVRKSLARRAKKQGIVTEDELFRAIR